MKKLKYLLLLIVVSIASLSAAEYLSTDEIVLPGTGTIRVPKSWEMAEDHGFRSFYDRNGHLVMTEAECVEWTSGDTDEGYHCCYQIHQPETYMIEISERGRGMAYSNSASLFRYPVDSNENIDEAWIMSLDARDYASSFLFTDDAVSPYRREQIAKSFRLDIKDYGDESADQARAGSPKKILCAFLLIVVIMVSLAVLECLSTKRIELREIGFVRVPRSWSMTENHGIRSFYDRNGDLVMTEAECVEQRIGNIGECDRLRYRISQPEIATIEISDYGTGRLYSGSASLFKYPIHSNGNIDEVWIVTFDGRNDSCRFLFTGDAVSQYRRKQIARSFRLE